MNNHSALFKKYCSGNEGSRFQKEFAGFAALQKPQLIVETGSGISTLFLLQNISKTTKLYSIDPEPWCGFEAKHPNYELIKKLSTRAMAGLFLQTGAWDIFLHDSNHDILVQTYEFNLAYYCLRPGGIIACDDYTWGGHKAWNTFIKANALRAYKLGDIELAVKPAHAPVANAATIYELHQTFLLKAEAAEKAWLAKGHKNTDVFLDFRV